MSKVVKDGRLEALPAGREPRRQELAELVRTDRKARAKLLADLYPLVERVAKKQSGLGVDYEDLIQAGMEGALKAIQRYTPVQGASFTTYAYPWIHGEMRRAIAWHRTWHQRTIRVPEYRVLLAGKERRVRERLQHELGRTPTDLEVARELGVEVDEIWKLAAETAPITSADVLMEAAEEDDPDAGRRASESQIRFLSPENRHDLTGEPERIGVRRVLSEELREELRRSLCKVRDRDRDVLRLKHWRGYPRWAIAAQLGITVEGVRWSEKRAKDVLKEEKNLEEIWEVFRK